MKGAYFEALSDMLTSIGVIVAGVIMLTTGWYYADPLISAGIGASRRATALHPSFPSP